MPAARRTPAQLWRLSPGQAPAGVKSNLRLSVVTCTLPSMTEVETIQEAQIASGQPTDASTAQVWAADARRGRYVFMAPGDADVYRADAKSGHLVCPVPECENPAFEAVGKGPSRRHHFRHVSGQRHAPETIDHVQAKAMLSEWARGQASDAAVAEEMTLKEPLPVGGYLNRRADVGIAWSSGERIAIEVEYKVAESVGWLRKQAEYVEATITSTWLIGHTSKHLRARDETRVRLGDSARTIAGAGVPLLTVNPYERTIGTLVVDDGHNPVADQTDYYRLAGPEDRLARVVTAALSDCRLDPARGLITPLMDEIRLADAERRRRADEAAASRAANATVRARRRVEAEPEAVRALPYDERVAQQPRPDLSNLDHIHCGHCAHRIMVGLPVQSRPTPPRYLPWRDWSGALIAQPPPWVPGGRPLRQPC